MKRVLRSIMLCASVLAGNTIAAPFTIEIVADNDFAVFTGTESNIHHLLYQNDVTWTEQINELSSLTFNVAPGDNKFYILAMGGGTEAENISGLINGVNMTDPSVSVRMSSDIASFLTGYDSTAYFTGSNTVYAAVEDGTYDAILTDVQSAFSSPGFAWMSPTLNTTQGVIQASGFGAGYSFGSLEARLFEFDIADVNVEVPEPPLMAVLAALSLVFLRRIRCKKA
ncbi:hypothetical protein [Alteromonas gilva]|uniref:PEP-CTERM sorting domain-containing protein n=1 Tax=Alteromonas gilva TaxID=2987522 RepID=A0ABT5L0W0_9ALTE|nr:hypothetical protein [Alteromonas gilva]MDC8830688.1 hypothetical protein [Alteromonas gilva]